MPWKQIVENWTQALNAKYPEVAKTLKATLEQFGGAGGFIEQLKSQATQEKLKTWFQDGKQFVLSQEQVQKLIGNERIKAIAEKLSTTPDAIATQLAQVLPPLLEKVQAVSNAIPENSIAGKMLNQVKSWLGSNSNSNPNSDSTPPKT